MRRPRIAIRPALAALAMALGLAAPASADFVNFLVAEIPGRVVHGDSYILPLSDPAAIAHARALISQGVSAGDTIAVARIEPGSDGINRDMLAPGDPLWNWHVAQFLGFASNVSEVEDGWPTYVASEMVGAAPDTSQIIGFWNYTVVAEMLAPPDPNAGGGPTGAPEPGSLVLLAIGAASLLVAGRRIRRAGRRSAPPRPAG